MVSLQDRIKDDMKTAMRAREKARLAVIRLILAATKQKEIDERITLDDPHVLVILEKMVKQRRESIRQYENADRQDLADQEKFEITLLQEYLPEQMNISKVESIIVEIINSIGASGPQDMGKVIGALKPRIQGRADMGQASQLVKAKLNTV